MDDEPSAARFFAVMKFMPREAELKGIPMIVVSAKSMSDDICAGMGAGVSIYQTKPFNYLDLKHAVENLIGDGVDRTNPA